MATATKITGESFGYRQSGSLVMLNGTKLISGTITPVDSDLHDISKEGLLVSSLSWRCTLTSVTRTFFLGIFNRTTNIAPIANNSACAYRDSMHEVLAGAAYLTLHTQIERNLAILPGGGVPLIADFIAISAEADANVAADVTFIYDMYYKWIPINSDDYRKILYARSI